MATFSRAFQVIFIILAVHAVAILAGWYDHDSLFDVPMHFAGGAAMAYLALAAWNASIDKVVFKPTLKPFWREYLRL